MALQCSSLGLTPRLLDSVQARSGPPTPSILDPAATTDPTIYHSRTFHGSVVAGQYLYIDGGEIIFNNSGTIVTAQANDTYSIDLSTSWTNQTVKINQIIKSTAPVLNYETLWPHPDDKSFYLWGGEVSHLVGTITNPDWYPGNNIYQFTTNGASGTWNQVGAAANTVFGNLSRPAGGSGAVGNGVGYLFGGFSSPWTTWSLASSAEDMALPGMVSYDMAANSWTNHSTTGFTQQESGRYGQLEFIPNFGPAGLLMTLGGGIYPETGYYRTHILSQYLSTFQSLNFFEPMSGEWYRQTATGQIPDPRANFCSVGLSGDNGTYEIFIYGGFTFTNPVPTSLDSVYVLSLPSFNWQKADYPATTPRYLQTCNLAGNRQMVSVGGVIGAAQQQPTVADIWPLGLGVFDLTEMAWKDNYDPSAAAYETPATVKTWYSQNGLYPKAWDSPEVEVLFHNTTASTSSPSPSSKSHSSNAGAIAGGVVGGVVTLAIIGAILWFYRFRKPKCRQAQPKTGFAEAEMEGRSAEIKHQQSSNVPKGLTIQELGSQALHEVGGGQKHYEMP